MSDDAQARFDALLRAKGTTLILAKRLTFGSIDPSLNYPNPFAIALVFLGVRNEQIEHFRRLVPSMRMAPQLDFCPTGWRRSIPDPSTSETA